MRNLTLNRWLKALEIAKCLFEDEWYHTRYLEQIERFIKDKKEEVIDNGTSNSRAGMRQVARKEKLSLPLDP